MRSSSSVVPAGRPSEAGVQGFAARHLAPTLVFSLRPDQTCMPSAVDVPESVTVMCFHAMPQTT